MAFWVRFLAGDEIGFGTLADGVITQHRGDMLGEHSPTGSKHAPSSVRLLAPCTPSKLIGLWNNFHERAKPAEMRVQVALAGHERQDFPVSDMIFSPHEIVSRISGDITLEPGDLIARGTSVGACAMRDGDSVTVRIPGVGVLANRFG